MMLAKWIVFFKSQGVLCALACLLIVSGVMRIGERAGAAMALQANVSQSSSRLESAPALQCAEPPLRLIEAINGRDSLVSAREQILNDRFAALDLAERAIEARLVELEIAETKLSETLSLADGAAEADIQKLTAVYEAMKSSNAAELFQTMSPEFAAGFLSRMKPAAAALVLSGMNPENAYSISVLIAGRNANVPKK